MTAFFNDFIDDANRSNLGVYGIHIHRGSGEPLTHRFRADDRVHLFSGSKAFTSVAVGMAQAEGRLSLEDTVSSFFPDLPVAEGAAGMRVRDLLHMRSGHMNAGFSSDETTQEQHADWAALFLAAPVVQPPGTEAAFFYENTSTYMLSRIVEAVSGAALRDYLLPRLFAPLGIPNPQWHTCPRGHSLGAVGLFLKTDEFARLGQLLLQGGVWQGKQLLDPAYVNALQNDIAPSILWDDMESRVGYGYQFWRNTIPNSFRADGKYGQYSIVLHDYNAVVTVTAHNEKNAYNILRSVWAHILPKLA